jgi:hypothetical protein
VLLLLLLQTGANLLQALYPPFSIYLHKYPSCSRGKQLHVYWDSCGERRTHEVSRADETLKPTEEANSNSFNKEKEIRKKKNFSSGDIFPLIKFISLQNEKIGIK